MFVTEKSPGEVALPSREAGLPTQPMKLSEAIRIGAKLRPQSFRGFFRDGGSCALGAAVHAKTGRASPDFPTNWEEFFGVPNGLCGEIINLNDRKGWTREQIADWLESQGH